jgi:hypothetical protein
MTDHREVFREVIEHVSRELVHADFARGGAIIRVPIYYPSRAAVVVRVEPGKDNFFVTDMGLGYQEAELMGASLIYVRHSKSIAERAGIRFDNDSFFVVEASRNQLAGAIAAVANCSQEAVALAAYKLAERKAAEVAEELFERLVRIFTLPRVTKNAAVYGASHTEYHFAAMVTASKRPAVFEAVSPHHTSVFAANSKFHDVILVERPPIPFAVVRKKSELGTYHDLLAQVSNVIETETPDKSIKQLAEAA